MTSIVFTQEQDGLLSCTSEAVERDVFATFRNKHVSNAELSDESKLLFKITVEEGAKKSVCWVGAPHITLFSDVLALLNRKFSGDGVFMFKGGFGIRPHQSAGQVFMKYGHEFEYHPKTDLSRIAWHQRG